ncbi:MAG TPA: hypothetical protein VF412_06795 [Bdellovibrio sp.]|uniref:hypothetical protein n=1 Tax=Bdellovibrio sp. TaxID=28201 RepID=UPI002EEDDEE1
MRSLFLGVSTLLLLSPLGHAALGTDASSALSFFRSKQSLFPSGQASRTELESKMVHTEIEFSYQVNWDRKTYNLESDQILRDIQTARFVDTKTACEILADNRRDAKSVKSLSPKSTLEILETDSYWARVKEKNGKAQGWVPLHLLQARHEDTGVFVNVIDTYLRKRPEIPSGIVTTLPRLRRVIPLAIEKGFLKIQFENQIGYADINNFVSRADFANLAYSVKSNWITVNYRNGDMLVTTTGQQIPLKDILGFAPNQHRGIVIRTSRATGPQIHSRVEIIKPEANVWAISRLDGHGEVWWKKSNLLVEEEPKSATTITTDELMKREIYSLAFENKNSLRGLVSSEGVYRTEDGLTWTLIPQFGKKNYPVNIHPNGTWFVGSYKSNNEGKSFDPFIRWDQIASAIEGAYHRNSRLLRLTQIEALPNSQVQIYVDTGISKVKLRSSLEGGSWSVIKN